MLQNEKLTEPRSWLAVFVLQMGWIAILAGFACVVLTGVSVTKYLQGSEFHRNGVSVEAEVISQKEYAQGLQTGYLLVLRYEVPEGNFASKLAVSESFALSHPTGSKVEIYYLPQAPAEISKSKRVMQSEGTLMRLLAGILGVFGLGMTLMAGLRANTAVMARRFGTLGKAEVTRIEGIPSRHSITASTGRFVFLDSQGHFGKSFEHALPFLHCWQVGDTIDVYMTPRHSWWVEDLGPRESLPRELPKVR